MLSNQIPVTSKVSPFSPNRGFCSLNRVREALKLILPLVGSYFREFQPRCDTSASKTQLGWLISDPFCRTLQPGTQVGRLRMEVQLLRACDKTPCIPSERIIAFAVSI